MIFLSRGIFVLSFIPRHNGGQANLVHPREEGKCCKDDGRDNELPFVEELK